MVDFQERDTRRGLTDLEEEGHAGEAEPPADEGAHHHGHEVPSSLGIAVVTVSSTRSIDEDESGDVLVDLITEAGHTVPTRELIPDDRDRIQNTVATIAGRADADVVVTSGGTGITPDDVTPEAVEPLFDKVLPGFGELFRRRSEAEIGTRTVASRAVGGIVDRVPVFCLPGSEAAVRLGTGELILPEASHLVGLAGREE